jgi:hypothetical protein
MIMLTRYWFKFDLSINQLPPLGTVLGCGVTAASRGEAIQLLRDRVFHTDSLPPIKECVEGVDVDMLDQNHVRPNMGDPERRGIWFPLGY